DGDDRGARRRQLELARPRFRLRRYLAALQLGAIPAGELRARLVGALEELEDLVGLAAAHLVRQHEALAGLEPARARGPHQRAGIAVRSRVVERVERRRGVVDVAGPEPDLADLVRVGLALDDPAGRQRWRAPARVARGREIERSPVEA